MEDFYMDGFIKKTLFIACLSVSIAPISYSLTWAEMADKTAHGISDAAHVGASLIADYMPAGFAGRATVGGLGLGSAALYLSCYKFALASLAVGSCAAYVNYHYHQDRQMLRPAYVPGGVIVGNDIFDEGSSEYESLYAWLKRKWQTRHNPPAFNPYIRKQGWFDKLIG